MRSRLPLALTLAVSISFPALAQEWVAGIEANQAASYSYLTHYSRRPAGPGRQLVFWQTVSYLHYRVREGSGTTRVQSPGLAAGAMLRWNRGNLDAGAGAGWEVRWTSRDPAGAAAFSRTESGPVVTADLSARLNPRMTASAAVHHSGAIDWTSLSGDLRFAITPSLRVGPQVIRQGNDDLDVTALGGVIEVPFERTALQIRAGQARVEHRNGSTEREPYVSVGIARRF